MNAFILIYNNFSVKLAINFDSKPNNTIILMIVNKILDSNY